METTVVYSYEGDTLDITWSETELSVTVVKDCPCNTLTNRIDVASRTCGGDYTVGADWEDPSECPELSDTSIRLCLASEVSL